MRSFAVFLLASCAAPLPGQSAPEPAPALAPAPVASPAPAATQTAPADATELLAAFAKMEGLEARFLEEKHLTLLAAPLKCSGRLCFLRPGYLSRVIEEPEHSTLTITPSELRLEGKDGVEKVDLKQNDHVRQFVTSLVQVFAGDEEALKRSYDVGFTRGEADGTWVLTLTPKGSPLTDLLRDLRLSGKGLLVEQIEVREPSGDRTVTRIVQCDVQRRFSDDEKERLFGIRPR